MRTFKSSVARAATHPESLTSSKLNPLCQSKQTEVDNVDMDDECAHSAILV